MRDTEYAYCVARIRANENKLLTKVDIDALIEQKDFEQAMIFLSEKLWCDKNDSIKDAVKKQTDELEKLLNESVPDKDELKKLYILNDFFNVKAIIKCVAEKISAENFLLYPTTVNVTDYKKNALDGDFSFLGENLSAIAEKAYMAVLKSENGLYAEVLTDRAAVDLLCKKAIDKSDEVFSSIASFIADCANIKTALRATLLHQSNEFLNEAIDSCSKLDRTELLLSAKEGYDALTQYLMSTSYADGVKIYVNKPSDFERWRDSEIIKLTEKSVYTSFGFAPVTSFYYKKTAEIKAVKIILNGKKSKLSDKILKERVSMIYG